LPAIANVMHAMTRLSEGERVTIDAAAGLVTRDRAVGGP
jgi:phosphohistidine swiveling domain-containing protein